MRSASVRFSRVSIPANRGILRITYNRVLFHPHLSDSTKGMGAAAGNLANRDTKTIHKQLAELYSRRDAVESLIRCLESYAEFIGKGEQARQKGA